MPGPIPLVPAGEFSLDLRTPGLPALAATHPCEPEYDGLELHVPDVVDADLKVLAVSPFFAVPLEGLWR